MNEKLGIDDLA